MPASRQQRGVWNATCHFLLQEAQAHDGRVCGTSPSAGGYVCPRATTKIDAVIRLTFGRKDRM